MTDIPEPVDAREMFRRSTEKSEASHLELYEFALSSIKTYADMGQLSVNINGLLADKWANKLKEAGYTVWYNTDGSTNIGWSK